MDWLLDLQTVRWSQEGAALSWRLPLPAWAWAMAVAAVLCVAMGSYRRLLGPRWCRWCLALVRAGLILLVVALLLGPRMVVEQDRVQPGWVLLLVDRSASMQIRDVIDPSGHNEPISRDAALRAGLKRHATVFDLLAQGRQAGGAQTGRPRQLLWLGFDAGVFPIDAPLPDPDSLPSAEGGTTQLRSAIEQAIDQAGSSSVLGVVLFTDGQSPQATGAELIGRIKQHGASVYPVPLGGDLAPLDLTISRVEAPARAFVDDHVPVQVWVQMRPEGMKSGQVVVKLVDLRQADEPMDQRTVSAGDLDQPVTLSAQSSLAGPATWRVQVAAEPAGREVILDNNIQTFQVDFIDRPLRVLYVDGVPRWEYRYLKNLLMRDEKVTSSVLLTSADRSFAQEGDRPQAELPGTASQWQPFDVIVIGDVPPSYFGPEQLGWIKDQVSIHGAGLIVIGGPSHMPQHYAATSVRPLLPMVEPSQVRVMAAGPVQVRPTDLARTLHVLRLDDGQAGQPDATGRPAQLGPLQWVQDLGPLRPAAELLAEAVDRSDQRHPLLVTMRYGSGRVLYIGTDETWRWRYGRGEFHFERFWIPLIQLAGRSRVQPVDQRVKFSVSQHRAVTATPLVVRLRLQDAMLIDQRFPRIEVQVRHMDGGSAAGRLDLLAVGAVAGSGASQAYEAIWRARQPGRYMLHVVQAQLQDLKVQAGPIQVVDPAQEREQTQPDHERLARLADQTDGQVVHLDELDRLTGLIRQPQTRPDDISESLWDSPLALVVLLGLLTIEWTCRKWIRLA